jgi:AsmA family protein
LRGPIKVDGTLAAPAVHPQLGNVLLRSGVAVALGAVAGPAALIPFLQAGHDQQIDCAPHVNTAAQFVHAAG